MKLDFSSDNSAISLVEEDFAQNGHKNNDSPEVTEKLRAGIKAAQRGDRADARQLLLRVTETDPNNESAWLWLASISEYPEELLIFLNNVLDINPENERAIEWAKATKSLLAKTFVQRGIEANNQEQKTFARQCFMQAIVHDNRNEMAWLWLASVTDASEEKINHFHRVLEVNPDNETARESIRAEKEKMIQAAFEQAENAADNGNRDKAAENLKQVFEMNPNYVDGWFLKARLTDSVDEKVACFEKILDFEPENVKAREAVETVKGERIAELFAKANEAANDGDRELSNAFLAEVFYQNPTHEDAWILKSRLTDSFEEKIACFEKILEFNPANETAQAGVKLRAMLSGSAPKTEEKVSFPSEETVEQAEIESFETEYEDEVFSEENSYFADEEAEEDFSEQQESENEQVVETGENGSVTSFEDETVSATDETQEFSYFAEEKEQTESFEGQSSHETEDSVVEENVEENIEEYSFENESVHTDFDEKPVETELAENDSDQHQSDHSFEENQKSYDHTVFEKPADVFAEYAENYGLDNFNGGETYEPEVFVVNSAENFVPTETSENGFHAEINEAENFVEENSVEENSAETADVFAKMQGEQKACPFCEADNEAQAFVCHSCRSLLTLSDMEMILAYNEADQDVLKNAVEQLEVENVRRGLESEELVSLAIGHINLKNLRKGLEYLQKASKLDSNNVVIESQANSLAIRLSEIEEKESVHSSMPKDRTIMVVDDSATVRKLISGKLEKCGHIVITAVDGMDAMAKLNDIVPDLILLDITMPRMDGYQVCKLIRNSDTTKEIPIVMISGKDGFFDKVRGRMAGTTGYITKPFGPETLMKMLDTYLV